MLYKILNAFFRYLWNIANFTASFNIIIPINYDIAAHSINNSINFVDA